MGNNPITGAIKGDKDAMEELICSFEGLIVKQARKHTGYYNRGFLEFEDLKQIGYEAIIKAVSKVDENRIITAPSFIMHSITNAMGMEVRKMKTLPYLDSLYDEVDEGILLIDVVNSDTHVESDAIRNIMMNEVNKGCGKLKPEDAELLTMFINEPYGGLKKYADKYNESYRKVRYRKDVLLEKLKRIII